MMPRRDRMAHNSHGFFTIRFRHIARACVAIVLIGASFYVLLSAYRNVKEQAISRLKVQEETLARTASRAIETYFSTKIDILQAISYINDVIDLTPQGERILQDFFNSYPGDYYSITRMDAHGKILYSYPVESSVGTDISGQQHVRRLLTTQQPVLSDVFRSVQGHKTIALHIPVFRNHHFAGSLAVLLPFDRIADTFVSDIRIGKTGYAFLLSADGVELYCPTPGHIGKHITETGKNFPSYLAMISHMLRGENGFATYSLGKSKDSTVKNYAFYMPIRLYQTFWSICVAAPENEAMEFINGFRSRWFVALLLLGTAFGYCVFLLIRAYYSIQAKTRELASTAVHLGKANIRLQEIDKAKSAFIESVSHELRTPMTSIIGFVTIISKDFSHSIMPLIQNDTEARLKSDRIMANLDIIKLEGERLTRLINDVLDSAKIESGKLRWEDQVIQIKDFIWLAVNTIQGQAATGVPIEFSDDGSSPWIKADPDRIMQVMMNLLNNAVKFTEAGHISVRLQSNPAGFLTVSVEDTGIGIPSEFLEKIFEKFQQVVNDSPVAGKPKGTGLGLSICKQIVEHYHGRIWAESAFGLGSRFIFSLPVHTPS